MQKIFGRKGKRQRGGQERRQSEERAEKCVGGSGLTYANSRLKAAWEGSISYAEKGERREELGPLSKTLTGAQLGWEGGAMT